MKEWVIIHKLKALYEEGRGSSIRAIAQELKISRNIVRQYLRMDEQAISALQAQSERQKVLDKYPAYLIHLLQTYPRLSAVKVLRKLKAKVPELGVSDRSVRRSIQTLKATVPVRQQRYYEPVLDMLPGVQ